MARQAPSVAPDQERPPDRSVSDAWRESLTARRTRPAAGAHVPGTQASRPGGPGISRRRFIRGAFWSGLGLSLVGTLGAVADFVYPRGIEGFGSPVPAGNVADYPKGGEPFHNIPGQFLLVNLDPAETRPGGSGGGDGLLALWHRCPHLGCTVPWRGGFSFDNDAGWYRCPCHGSTYTKAGIRVFGPAPRSMDTMAVTVDEQGNIVVDTGAITSGSPENPERALPV